MKPGIEAYVTESRYPVLDERVTDVFATGFDISAFAEIFTDTDDAVPVAPYVNPKRKFVEFKNWEVTATDAVRTRLIPFDQAETSVAEEIYRTLA